MIVSAAVAIAISVVLEQKKKNNHNRNAGPSKVNAFKFSRIINEVITLQPTGHIIDPRRQQDRRYHADHDPFLRNGSHRNTPSAVQQQFRDTTTEN